MGKIFKLFGHYKRCLTAFMDLGRFSSIGMAASTTGDSTTPSLVQCAGTSNRAIPGGARRTITDMVSSLGCTPGGRYGCGSAVGAGREYPAQTPSYEDRLGANAIEPQWRKKAYFNAILQSSRSLFRT